MRWEYEKNVFTAPENGITDSLLSLRLSPHVFVKCDVIKQNGSEVCQIQFLFFWLIVYIICKATFYNRPHWNWGLPFTTDPIEIGQLVPKIRHLKDAKTSVLFGCILNRYLQVLTHLLALNHIKTHHNHISLSEWIRK